MRQDTTEEAVSGSPGDAFARRSVLRGIGALGGGGIFSGLATGRSQGLTSGSPAIRWNRTYDAGSGEVANALIETSNGGYAFGGRIQERLRSRPWFVKLNSAGERQWALVPGEEDATSVEALAEAPDGYVLGITDHAGDGATHLVKIGASHETVWTVQFPDPTNGIPTDHEYVPSAIVPAVDGGYTVTGTFYFGAGEPRAFAATVTQTGEIDWIEWYSACGRFDALVRAPESGYVIAGLTDPGCDYTYRRLLAKLSETGDLEWSREYDIPVDETQSLGGVVQADDGYVLGGTNPALDAPFLLKTDANGDPVWTRTYTLSGIETAFLQTVVEAPSDGYLFGGLATAIRTSSDVTKTAVDGLLVRTDSSGGVRWSETYGRSGDDSVESLIQTTTGCYAFAGSAGTASRGQDAWVVTLG